MKSRSIARDGTTGGDEDMGSYLAGEDYDYERALKIAIGLWDHLLERRVDNFNKSYGGT